MPGDCRAFVWVGSQGAARWPTDLVANLTFSRRGKVLGYMPIEAHGGSYSTGATVLRRSFGLL